MVEIDAEISVARGRILPIVSKASDRKICIPPTRSSGRKTIATTMIPMPPSHCNNPRHKSRPLGKSSNPENTVEPVVVRPDIASKYASTIVASVAPITKGIAPKIGKATQTPVVSKNVCCSDSRSFTPLADDSAINPPARMLMIALSRNTGHAPRPSAISTISGKSIVTPRKDTKRPIT